MPTKAGCRRPATSGSSPTPRKPRTLPRTTSRRCGRVPVVRWVSEMTGQDDRSPVDLSAEAAAVLRERTGVETHDVAVVLGSGWLPAADALGETVAELSTTELPGFAAPAVPGHSGKIRSVHAGDRNGLVFLGSTLLYGGFGVR